MALIECGECGGRLSDKAAACPHCGAPPTVSIACIECGGRLSDKAAACPACGAPPTAQPPITGTHRAWLIVIAVIASSPALLFFAAASSPNHHDNSGQVAFLGWLWIGAVLLCYTLINRAIDKAKDVARLVHDRANASTRFATDQVERRTVANERHVDAETIRHVAGAGKLADDCDTARRWTTKTDAFGRVVGDDDEPE